MLASILLTTSFGYSLPTVAEKTDCAKIKLTKELRQSGFTLVDNSLELKNSYHPVNLLYLGSDLISWYNWRGFTGSKVQFVSFEAKKNDSTIVGWMYVLSFVNIDGEPIHDCTVGNAGLVSSIMLGEIILEN